MLGWAGDGRVRAQTMSRVQSYEQALLLRIPDAPLMGHMQNARS